jgi:hypothetical protein
MRESPAPPGGVPALIGESASSSAAAGPAKKKKKEKGEKKKSTKKKQSGSIVAPTAPASPDAFLAEFEHVSATDASSAAGTATGGSPAEKDLRAFFDDEMDPESQDPKQLAKEAAKKLQAQKKFESASMKPAAIGGGSASKSSTSTKGSKGKFAKIGTEEPDAPDEDDFFNEGVVHTLPAAQQLELEVDDGDFQDIEKGRGKKGFLSASPSTSPGRMQALGSTGSEEGLMDRVMGFINRYNIRPVHILGAALLLLVCASVLAVQQGWVSTPSPGNSAESEAEASLNNLQQGLPMDDTAAAIAAESGTREDDPNLDTTKGTKTGRDEYDDSSGSRSEGFGGGGDPSNTAADESKDTSKSNLKEPPTDSGTPPTGPSGPIEDAHTGEDGDNLEEVTEPLDGTQNSDQTGSPLSGPETATHTPPPSGPAAQPAEDPNAGQGGGDSDQKDSGIDGAGGSPAAAEGPSGPKPSGPKPSGPKPSGPKPSGPKPSGPKPSGPNTSGPNANSPPQKQQPSGGGQPPPPPGPSGPEPTAQPAEDPNAGQGGGDSDQKDSEIDGAGGSPAAAEGPSGPKPSGPKPSGPKPSEPKPSGPKPSGPKPSGPNTSGPNANSPPQKQQPSGGGQPPPPPGPSGPEPTAQPAEDPNAGQGGGDSDQKDSEIDGAGGSPAAAEGPSGPKPSGPKPSGPKPSGPKPSEPKRSGPKPSEPKPSEPKPSEPKPSGPKPSGPKPSEPKPSGPKPSGPKPSGPNTSGPNANSPPQKQQPSGGGQPPPPPGPSGPEPTAQPAEDPNAGQGGGDSDQKDSGIDGAGGSPAAAEGPSGPKPSGPKPSGPKPSGPKPSGPKPSGPKPSGPNTSGPNANSPPQKQQPSGGGQPPPPPGPSGPEPTAQPAEDPNAGQGGGDSDQKDSKIDGKDGGTSSTPISRNPPEFTLDAEWVPAGSSSVRKILEKSPDKPYLDLEEPITSVKPDPWQMVHGTLGVCSEAFLLEDPPAPGVSNSNSTLDDPTIPAPERGVPSWFKEYVAAAKAIWAGFQPEAASKENLEAAMGPKPEDTEAAGNGFLVYSCERDSCTAAEGLSFHLVELLHAFMLALATRRILVVNWDIASYAIDFSQASGWAVDSPAGKQFMEDLAVLTTPEASVDPENQESTVREGVTRFRFSAQPAEGEARGDIVYTPLNSVLTPEGDAVPRDGLDNGPVPAEYVDFVTVWDGIKIVIMHMDGESSTHGAPQAASASQFDPTLTEILLYKNKFLTDTWRRFGFIPPKPRVQAQQGQDRPRPAFFGWFTQFAASSSRGAAGSNQALPPLLPGPLHDYRGGAGKIQRCFTRPCSRRCCPPE